MILFILDSLYHIHSSLLGHMLAKNHLEDLVFKNYSRVVFLPPRFLIHILLPALSLICTFWLFFFSDIASNFISFPIVCAPSFLHVLFYSPWGLFCYYRQLSSLDTWNSLISSFKTCSLDLLFSSLLFTSPVSICICFFFLVNLQPHFFRGFD